MLTIDLLRDNFKVELFVSTFNVGQGLIPGDWTPEGALSGLDYNPNRIFEATWENGNWNWFDRQGNRQTQPGSAGGFDLPESTTSPQQIETQLWNMAAHLH